MSMSAACTRPPADAPEHRLDGRERVVEGALHEDLAQHLRHEHLAPAGGGEDAGARPGRGLGVVERAQHARLGLDELEHVGLVEGVVAQRDHIGARVEQRAGMGGRQPRARGRVLAVDYDEVEPPVGAQPGQALGHGGAARPPDDVAEEEKSHAPSPRTRADARASADRRGAAVRRVPRRWRAAAAGRARFVDLGQPDEAVLRAARLRPEADLPRPVAAHVLRQHAHAFGGEEGAHEGGVARADVRQARHDGRAAEHLGLEPVARGAALDERVDQPLHVARAEAHRAEVAAARVGQQDVVHPAGAAAGSRRQTATQEPRIVLTTSRAVATAYSPCAMKTGRRSAGDVASGHHGAVGLRAAAELEDLGAERGRAAPRGPPRPPRVRRAAFRR
jgi:hypothetical protein